MMLVKYSEIDEVINSLTMSINDMSDVFIQLNWLQDLIMAKYIKSHPSILSSQDAPCQVFDWQINNGDQQCFWKALCSWKRYMVENGIYYMAYKLMPLYIYRDTILAVAKNCHVDINIGMLDNFMNKYFC